MTTLSDIQKQTWSTTFRWKRRLYYSKHTRSSTWHSFVCHRGSCHVRRTWAVRMQRDGVVSSYFGLFFHLSDLVEVEPQEQEQEMRLWKSRPHDVTIISCLLLTRQLNPQHHPLALYIGKELLLLASLNTKNKKRKKHLRSIGPIKSSCFPSTPPLLHFISPKITLQSGVILNNKVSVRRKKGRRVFVVVVELSSPHARSPVNKS